MESKSVQSIASSTLMPIYDVFVSFRGEDVRFCFADHLFAAFHRKGIVAFRYDTNIKQGEHISTELIEAIEGSRVLIAVFSKNYANSSWCLRELAKIVDCINREAPAEQGQVVVPVFYDVSPSEVRKQSGDYGKAFEEHEQRFKNDLGMVQTWRQALVQAADLSGSDIRNKPQVKEIETIVKRVLSILGNKIYCLPNNDLVGMQSHMDELEKFVVLDSHDEVRVVGIWGMGGIGKTTLAQVLYHRFSHQYDVSVFIDDVSKVYQRHGPLGVHKQLHCQVLNEEIQDVWSVSKATYLTRTILSKEKAFIVLDNVDEAEQLEGLIDHNRELLRPGSKIIVVSRNKHIFEQFGANRIYQVQCLNEDDTLQLFCRKAFRCDYIMKEYEELTCRALEYVQGHPLAITILGMFLLGRNISEWTSALDSLRDNPPREIMDVLRISFDGLQQTEKEIFLDIACFFNHDREIKVKRILKCCGFHPEIGIRVLIDQSLLNIDKYGNIKMHDMLVELGKKIVRKKAPNDPRKWSRIWSSKDFQNIVSDKATMEDIEAIQLEHEDGSNQKRILRAEVLSAMSSLRLLIVQDNFCVIDFCEPRCMSFSGSIDCLSNKLQYLEWLAYPFTCLPSSFEPIKLVELILHPSNIKRLWEDTKNLPNLRVMDLRYSKNLIKTPDFRGLTNLEELNLEGSANLEEVHPSIGLLKKLTVLNLRACTSLRSLPYSIFGLSSLEVLNLSHCRKAFNNKLLGDGRHLMKLDGSETAMKCKSTSSILNKFSFQFFSSAKRKNNIVALMLPSFQCMQELNLYKCNLPSIPEAIGSLHCLEKLNLGGNDFVTLPSSMKDLPRLKSLYLTHCRQLKYLPELTLSTDLLTKTASDFVPFENSLPGLYIFNCPKLIGAEIWSNNALSWMIQFLKVHHKSLPCFDQIHCIVPGSQVPMWFENQSAGNTIIMDDSDWIGLALCAAFVVPAGHHLTILDEWSVPMQFTLHRRDSSACYYIPVDIEKDLPINVDLDHKLLLYLPREYLIYGRRDLSGMTRKLCLCFSYSHASCYSLVKKWGFRLVYKQDLESEELTPTMSNLCLESKQRVV